MQVTPLYKRSALLSFLLLGAFALGLTGAPAAESTTAPGIASADALVIGPGKVALRMSSNGCWLGFIPEWADRSLLAGGGIVVYAEDTEGRLREIASTRRELEAREDVPTAAYHEGIDGGFRAPSVNADDDSDGYIDEDRVDGIDNDGDGLVDEILPRSAIR